MGLSSDEVNHNHGPLLCGLLIKIWHKTFNERGQSLLSPVYPMGKSKTKRDVVNFVLYQDIILNRVVSDARDSNLSFISNDVM